MGRKIAYTGMLLAVDVTIFLMVNLFQTNTIFLLGLASLPIAIVIMNWGPKTGIVFYLASVLLIPDTYAKVYVDYLMAQIDFYNRDMGMYNNQIAVFSNGYQDFKNWYIRNHMPMQPKRTGV